MVKKKTQKNIINLFECPKCHKQYKSIGWFKRHCKTVHNGVLPYIKKVVMKERDLKTLIQETMIEVLGSMNFSSDIIGRIKKECKESKKEMIPAFEEYKNLIKKNGKIDLIHVPEEELHQIYNIMVIQ